MQGGRRRSALKSFARAIVRKTGKLLALGQYLSPFSCSARDGRPSYQPTVRPQADPARNLTRKRGTVLHLATPQANEVERIRQHVSLIHPVIRRIAGRNGVIPQLITFFLLMVLLGVCKNQGEFDF